VSADRPGLGRRAAAEGLAAFAGVALVIGFVIMAVATDTRAVGAAAAIAIGATVGLDALFGGPVTGPA
jgi:aquaporin NIP